MSNYIRYPNINYVMPLLFANDLWILIFDELLKEETNPIKHAYGSVYCAWQSGRHANVHTEDLKAIEKYLKKVKQFNIFPNFTFSSITVDNEKLKDNFSNSLLDIAYENDSYFIVSSDLLYKHIKSRYSDAKMISSVIAPSARFCEYGFNETEFYKEMLDKYEIVVIRPEYTMENIDKLDKILPDIERVEVLINQNCFYNCPNHKRHYTIQEQNDALINKAKKENIDDLEIEEDINSFCPHYNVAKEDFRSVRMNVPQVEQLIQLGVKNFKIQGRVGGINNFINDLYEFMFNNEIELEEIKNQIDTIVSRIARSNRAIQYLYFLD